MSSLGNLKKKKNVILDPHKLITLNLQWEKQDNAVPIPHQKAG